VHDRDKAEIVLGIESVGEWKDRMAGEAEEVRDFRLFQKLNDETRN
jgi:hypothetical protein